MTFFYKDIFNYKEYKQKQLNIIYYQKQKIRKEKTNQKGNGQKCLTQSSILFAVSPNQLAGLS